MFTVRRIAIGVPLLVISGIAGQVFFSSKVTGDMVAAHWNAGPYGVVDVIPADTPDSRAYSVFWQSCTLNPDFEHRYCVFAGGLVPKSAIRIQQVDSIGIEVDTSMLTVVFSKGGEDCRSGTCMPFTPQSVPLNGVFTIYRGPGSFSEEAHGSTRREDILPYGGMTSSQSFSGTRIWYSANFAGTVGFHTIAPMQNGYNASINIMKGQQTFQTVYPPAP